ncbi:transcription elongation regulator 1-like protein isoform X4 [Cygnus atratus]|uniref:transcription elongation regulator 1-like protein isoform X4 n=1 Tax=Cygnus atratus TaxID=8868 RepID=UPI0021B74DD0|nr:transcription elongation regulator 1-like protein isoform X4 [Cygnus atratus]
MQDAAGPRSPAAAAAPAVARGAPLGLGGAGRRGAAPARRGAPAAAAAAVRAGLARPLRAAGAAAARRPPAPPPAAPAPRRAAPRAVDIWRSFSGHRIFTVFRCGICSSFSTCVHIYGSASRWKKLDREKATELQSGCQNSLKPVSSNQTLALAAAATAAMMSVESEAPQGPSPPSIQPCHVLTFSPIKIPVLTSPFPGSASRVDARVSPLMPTQVARVTAVSAPAVTFMTTNLMDQALTDNGKESSRPSCPPTLILHADRKSAPVERDGDKDHSFKLVNEDDSSSNGNKPVASTPVPGSPWCVVWTGDDRVFFFNPTMQLSVWEKPVDLKHRGDINRIIEDPPHKRKLEAAATDKSVSSCPGDENDDLSIKIKRNKTEDSQAADQGEAEMEEKKAKTSGHQITPPLEERITHFRDMLLERGVSAFSTWEKELHKIVFDPRYLLLNSEERKQIFEQFVKTRIREEYKEKKNKLLLAKEEFKKLLEESKLSPRTTFKEFAEKYGRDQRFRLVQKKKDQEHFFNQFILILKKRDKENRIRLRKMR